ncbi:MAG: AAA family ATPase [Lachnospiraceae bacterium]|nr:AAA family ATPase [Lachnospiraceae bacterium]
MRKTKVICFANNKGGSGKSTTCSNVGAALAEAGKHVLLIDGDMQLNLSLSVLEEDDVLRYAQSEQNLYRAINKQDDLTGYIVKTNTENINIIPSSTLMSSIECDLFTKMQRELILRKCLKKVRESGVYDYILIDAPPTLGGWVINILCASDHLVIPVESSPWGLFGLANMFDFVDTTKDIAPQLTMLGVLITKIDERKNYYKQTMESLAELPDIHVFKNCIHVDSNVEWAQDNCRTVVSYKKSSRSAREYVALAKEIDRLCQ